METGPALRVRGHGRIWSSVGAQGSIWDMEVLCAFLSWDSRNFLCVRKSIQRNTQRARLVAYGNFKN